MTDRPYDLGGSVHRLPVEVVHPIRLLRRIKTELQFAILRRYPRRTPVGIALQGLDAPQR